VIYKNGKKGWIGYKQWTTGPHWITGNTFYYLNAIINIDGYGQHTIELPLNHNGYRYEYSYGAAYNIIEPLVRAYIQRFE
jgi:hypothetical protein